MFQLKLSLGSGKLWVDGIYKTTYYARRERGEEKRERGREESYHNNITSDGAYATSVIQNTFFQGHIDQCSLLWEVLCLMLGLQEEKCILIYEEHIPTHKILFAIFIYYKTV